MALSAVQGVSFKGNECKNCQKKTGGAVPLIASAMVPGLGQYIDGRGQAGKKFFLRNLGYAALAGITAGVSTALAQISTMAKTKAKQISGVGGAAIMGGIAVAATVKGIINHYQNLKDAYQGEKNVDA